jgi:peptide/nickel transport system substrate-binding protein
MRSDLHQLTDNLTHGRISRREFIARAAALTGSLSLALTIMQACGSSNDATETTAATGASQGGSTQSSATSGSSGATSSPSAEGAASPTTAGSATATGAAGVAQAGGTYTHGSPQEPDRFWGPITGLTVSSEISELVNATLVKTDDKLQFVPDLAEEVPTAENGGISSDGLTYTFKLRQGVTWHDGKPFTSKDVKFTYDVIMMDGVDVRGRVGWDQIASVETPDDNTVVYTFKDVYAPFLTRVAATGILPEHILSGLSADAINKHQWFQAPVGLGPFLFKEWSRGSYITLEKNPNYFKAGEPYFDKIVYKIIPDANTLVNQLETHDIDTTFRLSNENVGIVTKFPDVTVNTTPSVTPWVLWINNTIPIFSDKRVRQALEYGFDKEGLCSKLLKGLVEPAWGMISPLSWAYNPDIPKHTFDQDKAKQLLDEAGWKAGSGGIREKDGTKLSFEIINIAGEQERVQILSFIQGQWKEIGVDANIKMVDVGTMWGKDLPTLNYQMGYSYSGLTADPDMSSLYLSPKYKPGANFAGYSNDQVDQLLLNALKTVDQNERKKLYGQAQEIVAEDTVYIFLAWLSNHTALNKRIQGYKPAPAYVEFWNADEWWIKA